MSGLLLPAAHGGVERYALRGRPAEPATGGAPLRSRVVFAAAHVVADPLADNTPGTPATVDWAATLRFRHHLWSLGLGVADAMDTAQRGMGLDWPAAAELIRRSAKEAASVDGALAVGVGTDQVEHPESLDAVLAAYTEQLDLVESVGAQPILMASRGLAAVARGPEDYAGVYDRLLSQVSRPVILHWLGPMFDPALAGYWGSADLDRATGTLLEIIESHAAKVDGIKVSLLDADREIDLRRRLPAGVRCYTGDDYNYRQLIKGDEHGWSDALLGVFDVIAGPAATAVRALDAGDDAAYQAALAPTEPLARAVFAPPTRFYKTGVVFLAWLAGHQDHFRMVGGLESARSLPHLAELFRLADRVGLFPDPDLAVHRFGTLLAVAGVTP
jgi:hypothetical protein